MAVLRHIATLPHSGIATLKTEQFLLCGDFQRIKHLCVENNCIKENFRICGGTVPFVALKVLI